jgi:hypothetical protein
MKRKRATLLFRAKIVQPLAILSMVDLKCASRTLVHSKISSLRFLASAKDPVPFGVCFRLDTPQLALRGFECRASPSDMTT